VQLPLSSDGRHCGAFGSTEVKPVENRMPAILVMDDDGDALAEIEAVLKRNGFDVVVARDGRTGLGLFSTEKFDAVVIDIFMPEMDGIATIRQLRGLDRSIPIIAMSGRAFTDPRNGAPDFLGMAVKLGADHALQKPFGSDQFVQAILRSLANREQLACATSPAVAVRRRATRRA
jgi:two-component system, response regulator, stage 0 sporulation protein F